MLMTDVRYFARADLRRSSACGGNGGEGMVGAVAGSGSRPLPAGTTPEVAMLGSARWVTPTPSPRNLARLGNFFRRLAVRSSTSCRYRRGRLFIDRLQPSATDKILDLGGGRGGYLAGILPYRSN